VPTCILPHLCYIHCWWVTTVYCTCYVHVQTYAHRQQQPFNGAVTMSRYQKGKTNLVLLELVLLEQDIVSGSDISWAICKSAPWPRHIIMRASHHSVFYWPDGLPATQPTASKHCIAILWHWTGIVSLYTGNCNFVLQSVQQHEIQLAFMWASPDSLSGCISFTSWKLRSDS